VSVTTTETVGSRVVRLLEQPRYEVLPLEGVEESVLEHVPREVKLTVTASPSRGIDLTIAVASRLSRHGFEVVPHISARLVRDEAHLRDLLERIDGLGLREVFVVAGDAQHPAGPFAGAAQLLAAMAKLDHRVERIGITGYPESHPLISDDSTIQAMFEKAEFATYIVSQICFDPLVTTAWIGDVWRRGTRLPIQVGVPGAVSRAKLLRVSARIGLGESTRFLRLHGSLLTRALRPGGFSPGELIAGIEPGLADPEQKIGGFHIFTFNDVADTERWRQQELERRRATLYD
jgi:methylenetetrahydrofolate reductase (NADPH)